MRPAKWLARRAMSPRRSLSGGRIRTSKASRSRRSCLNRPGRPGAAGPGWWPPRSGRPPPPAASRPIPLEDPVLHHPQDLLLGLQGDQADLVQEQGAPVRGLEAPGPAARGPGEGPGLVAEKLGFQKAGGQGGAVQGGQGSLPAGREIVEPGRGQLLAGCPARRSREPAGPPWPPGRAAPGSPETPRTGPGPRGGRRWGGRRLS